MEETLLLCRALGRCDQKLRQSCVVVISCLTQMSRVPQPLGRGGSSEGQRAVENWASTFITLPPQKSIALLDERAVTRLIVGPAALSKHKLCISLEHRPSAALISACFHLDPGGCRHKEQEEDEDKKASPGACWGRLFSLTKDVRSHGRGKSCWSELRSASLSCSAAHL